MAPNFTNRAAAAESGHAAECSFFPSSALVNVLSHQLGRQEDVESPVHPPLLLSEVLVTETFSLAPSHPHNARRFIAGLIDAELVLFHLSGVHSNLPGTPGIFQVLCFSVMTRTRREHAALDR